MSDKTCFEKGVEYILNRWPALVMAKQQMSGGNLTLDKICFLESQITAFFISRIRI